MVKKNFYAYDLLSCFSYVSTVTVYNWHLTDWFVLLDYWACQVLIWTWNILVATSTSTVLSIN